MGRLSSSGGETHECPELVEEKVFGSRIINLPQPVDRCPHTCSFVYSCTCVWGHVEITTKEWGPGPRGRRDGEREGVHGQGGTPCSGFEEDG